MKDETCWPNRCVCQNGNPAKGAQCPINGAQKCVPADCDFDESGDGGQSGNGAEDIIESCGNSNPCNPGYKTCLKENLK